MQNQEISSTLGQIRDELREIESGLKTGRVFDILEILRDHVRELRRDHERIREAVRDVRRSATSSTQPL